MKIKKIFIYLNFPKKIVKILWLEINIYMQSILLIHSGVTSTFFRIITVNVLKLIYVFIEKTQPEY